ncbi:MAG: aldehyde dehydrogenase family protein [Deltaproteobacteria bacterium]|nr:aldehyde dehydrogenase family protein [Deltaproteobacteria bacterium]
MDSDPLANVRAAFDTLDAGRRTLAASTAQDRIARLRRIRSAALAQREALCAAVGEDLGRPAVETELGEVYMVVSEIDHAIAHLAEWMEPERVPTPLLLTGTHSEIRYEPKGRILVLAPWNFPFQLVLVPLVAALAAGNCVAVRPSSRAPHTARFLEGFLAGLFPPEEVAVFQGGHEVADALLDLPFDHVFFTGSARTGRKVMVAAARHLASVTLELGGKSPALVDRSADVAKSAERILWGKCFNAGQSCIAPDYVLVHRDLEEAFLAAGQRVLEARYGADETARGPSPSMGRMIDAEHHAKVLRLLEDAVAAGARVVAGGTSRPEERYLAPTILAGVRPEMSILQEEIFGPVLPVLPFGDLDEAIEFVQARPRPLSLYVFARDRRAVERVLRHTTVGGTCVNTTLLHFTHPGLPFGGNGESGMGSAHGHAGFLEFSHAHAVLVQGRPDGIRTFYPPYSEKKLGLVRKAIRFLA